MSRYHCQGWYRLRRIRTTNTGEYYIGCISTITYVYLVRTRTCTRYLLVLEWSVIGNATGTRYQVPVLEMLISESPVLEMLISESLQKQVTALFWF